MMDHSECSKALGTTPYVPTPVAAISPSASLQFGFFACGDKEIKK